MLIVNAMIRIMQIMPHITIKSQFEIDDNELDSIKEEVKTY